MPPPRLEPPPAPTLDELILQAEERLMAREARLRVQTQALGQRVQRAAQPGRLLIPIVGGAVAIWAARWALRRWAPSMGRRFASRAAVESAAAAAASAAANTAAANGAHISPPWWHKLPWLSAFSWAWPLLPPTWRARVSPRLASWAVAVGVPLARQLFRPAPPSPRRPPPPPRSR